MKAYEVKAAIEAACQRPALTNDKGFSVLVLGDEPQNIQVVETALKSANIPFKKVTSKNFSGARFNITMQNTGDTFNANWTL